MTLSWKLWALTVGAAFAALSYLLWQLWAQSAELSAATQAKDQLTIERDRLVETNDQNTESLQLLARNQALSDVQLKLLATELANIQVALEKSQEERNELAQKDPKVKDFLSLPIPDALRVQQPARN